MNERKKAWLEKNNILVDGFVSKYCTPEHVQYVLGGQKDDELGKSSGGYFVGFDGRKTTYEGLTEEEKEDWKEQEQNFNYDQAIEEFQQSFKER